MGAPRDSYLTFAGAGEREIQYTGRHIRVRDTPAGPIFLQVDGVPGEFERSAGEQLNFDGAPFQRIRVRSAVAQTVHLILADTPQDDSRTAVALTVSATVTPAVVLDNGGDQSIGAASAADVQAGDPDTLAVIVTSLETNDPSAPLRVGTAGVGAANGQPIYPGDSVTLATTATVRVYNPHGTSQDVAVVRLTQ